MFNVEAEKSRVHNAPSCFICSECSIYTLSGELSVQYAEFSPVNCVVL